MLEEHVLEFMALPLENVTWASYGSSDLAPKFYPVMGSLLGFLDCPVGGRERRELARSPGVAQRQIPSRIEGKRP
jgi:hypothetical protein